MALHRRSRIIATALATAAMLLGCGGPAASPTPGPTSGDASPLVRVTDTDSGTAVQLRTGQRLLVVLHSTYWRALQSSDRVVLRPEGSPAVSPAPGCVPGGGCGTVTASFVGSAPGQTTVTASRTSCGEALTCTGGAGSFALTVLVRA